LKTTLTDKCTKKDVIDGLHRVNNWWELYGPAGQVEMEKRMIEYLQKDVNGFLYLGGKSTGVICKKKETGEKPSG